MRLERFENHPDVLAAFTGRLEGDLALREDGRAGEVLAARAFVASGLGFEPRRLRFMRQVHSAHVAPVAPAGGPAPTADALLDPLGVTAPVVLTADCVPVVFAAAGPLGTVLAVAHAGRNGLLAGVLSATARAIVEARGEKIEAWVGPSVCGACYEVPEAMRESAEALSPGIGATTSWGTPSLDLPNAAARQLASLGVLVHSTGACTLHQEGYHSYRGGDEVGRNGSLVVSLPR